MTSNRPARRGRIALVLGFGSLLALAGCDKGPDKAQTAAELKSGVEAQLKRIEGGAQKVMSHSAVTVTPQGDGYLVSIEGLKIQPEPEGYLDIGTVSYVATPKDEKSYEVSDLKLPQAMPFKSPDGKEHGKLTVTTKAFSGLWLKEVSAFQKLDSEFTDIAAVDDSAGDVRIADAKIGSQLTDKGSGIFDIVANAVLSGFTAKDTGGGTFSIAESHLDGTYDSVKLADYQAAIAKYQELMVKQVGLTEASGNGTQPATLSPEDTKAMADAVSTMAASIKGGNFKLALNGLKYSDGGKDPFTLGALTLGTNIDGINQEKATLGFDIAHQDLALAMEEMQSPVDQAALPKSGNLSLKVSAIPSKDIVKVFADNLPGMASSDMAMAEANATAMFVALEAVLQTSGAKIEVAPSQLLSQLVEVKTDGAFDVTPQAAYGVVGALNVAIRGLDDLLALAQKTPDDPSAQQAVGGIGMLQQYSAREQGADGKPVDKYKIEVNEQGQLLVNGKPM